MSLPEDFVMKSDKETVIKRFEVKVDGENWSYGLLR